MGQNVPPQQNSQDFENSKGPEIFIYDMISEATSIFIYANNSLEESPGICKGKKGKGQ